MRITKMMMGCLCLLLLLSACGRADASDNQEKKGKLVKSRQVSYESVNEERDYLGRVYPEKIMTYASKIPGKIKKVYVTEGQYVEPSTLLFEVDAKDIKISKENKVRIQEQVRQILEKAKLARDYQSEAFKRGAILYQEGALSKVSYDALELAYDQAKLDVENAEQEFERASIDLEKESMDVIETKVYASEAGYVITCILENEAYVSSGQPVVQIQSVNKKIVFGLTQEERSLISLGHILYVLDDDEKLELLVNHIGTMPDVQTNLYEMEVILPQALNDEFTVGELVEGMTYGDEISGILLPVAAVQKDSSLFVYVIEGEKVIRKNIDILRDMQDYLLVDGLEDGEELVIEGMTTVDPNDSVIVISEVMN